DKNSPDRRFAFQQRRENVQALLRRVVGEGRRVRVEPNPAWDAQRALGERDHRRAAVRAAVRVRHAVPDLGLHRAAIGRIRDPVAIVVRVGAAVIVLEIVAVLGLVRTAVLGVRDAVVIVVGIGTAVGVLEAVTILGLVRAAVGRVDDAVVIRVRGAAVRRRRAGFPRALVVRIRDTVSVAIGRRGATVRARRTGLVWAAIERVGHSVVVGVGPGCGRRRTSAA